MRVSIISATLALAAGTSALPQKNILNGIIDKILPVLPLDIFQHTPKLVTPVPFEQARQKFVAHNETTEEEPQMQMFRTNDFTTMATCGNVRVRTEWHALDDAGRQAFVDGVKCLMSRGPSGQFPQSKSRYEDLVALHQTLTPNVHSAPNRPNHKFLVWHRYYLWTFESMLQQECGYNRPVPWFDETKYAGRFAQSSIFSSRWFGGIALNGQCVTDGQFANLALNVGPGQGNQLHCLARAGDGSKTANCNQAYVDQCNAWGDFASMAECAEGGPHAWGHNGIGAVMQDTWASPADPVFFLHHAFIDRNYRIWQNANSGVRTTTINGNDINGRPLTLDMNVDVYGIRPAVQIRDILDTTATTLCYKYNY